MTRLLKKAYEEASQLPDTEQDSIAKWLLEELESERRWSEQFAGSTHALERLSSEAQREVEDGHVEELDPDKL